MGGGIRGITNMIGLTEDKDLSRAMGGAKANAALMQGLELPNLKWEEYSPEMFTPEMLEFQTTNEDPSIRANQLQALERLGGLADTGLSEVDEYAYNKATNLGGQMARAGTEAALQNAASRGIAGSGLEFAMREKANQEGAQRAQEAALSQAADAGKQRAQYAVAYQNALGQQRSQDFANNKANTDIINQFNQANTNTRNQAQQMNNQTRADAFKYNQEGRQGTQQQNFNNDKTKRSAVAGANDQVSQYHLANSASKAQQGQALINAGMTAAFMSDKNQKKNIQTADNELEDMLNHISPVKFKYKNEKFGEGQKFGLLAQDLAKTKAGSSAVVDTSEGKMLDPKSLSALALAAVASLNGKMNNLR